MSLEHVEVVRRACDAWGAGDISTFRDLYAPDVVAQGGSLWPDAEGSVTGADAIIRNFEAVRSAFQHTEIVPEAFLDAGEKLVVALLWRGVLPGSESPVEQRLICAYEFRDGLIARIAWFQTLGEALVALQLPSSAAEELVLEEKVPRKSI